MKDLDEIKERLERIDKLTLGSVENIKIYQEEFREIFKGARNSGYRLRIYLHFMFIIRTFET